MPAIVLNLNSATGTTTSTSPTYLRKPKVPVDVAMSFRGMAACRAVSGG